MPGAVNGRRPAPVRRPARWRRGPPAAHPTAPVEGRRPGALAVFPGARDGTSKCPLGGAPPAPHRPRRGRPDGPSGRVVRRSGTLGESHRLCGAPWGNHRPGLAPGWWPDGSRCARPDERHHEWCRRRRSSCQRLRCPQWRPEEPGRLERRKGRARGRQLHPVAAARSPQRRRHRRRVGQASHGVRGSSTGARDRGRAAPRKRRPRRGPKVTAGVAQIRRRPSRLATGRSPERHPGLALRSAGREGAARCAAEAANGTMSVRPMRPHPAPRRGSAMARGRPREARPPSSRLPPPRSRREAGAAGGGAPLPCPGREPRAR